MFKIPNINRISFRSLIYSLFVFGILCIVIVSSIATSLMAKKVATDHFMERGLVVTEAMASRSQLGVLYSSKESVLEVIQIARSYPDLEQIGVWDAEGDLLEKYGQTSVLQLDDLESVSQSKKAKIISQSEDFILFVAPVRVEQEHISSPFDDTSVDQEDSMFLGYVSILMNKNEIKELHNTIIKYNFLITVIISILLLGALIIITGKLTSPLSILSESMRKVANGDKDIFVPLTGAREVQDISNVFNQMTSVLSYREYELKAARDEALTYAKVKEQFTASITHEIRTPINGIYAALQILEDMSLSDEQREYLQLALGSSELLMSLVNDILDYSKMSADQMKLENIEFKLPAIIENTATLQANTEAASHLDVIVFYESSLPEVFIGDPTRIQQIVNNLLGNAIKFTKKGSVTLSVERVIEDQQQYVMLSVKDTGIGIPKKDLQKVFDAYSQQDVSTSRKYGGTGLGLSICKQLAELMGGKILVESEAGVGTRFSVHLPLVPVELKASVRGGEFHRQFKVFIYSDSTTDQEVLKNAFERLSIPFVMFESLDDLILQVHQYQLPNDPHRVVVLSLKDIARSSLQYLYEACNQAGYQRSSLWYLTRKSGAESFPFPDLVHHFVHKPIRLDEIRRILKKDGQDSSSRDVSREVANKEQTKAIRVLLVEDNPVNQKVANAILKKIGVNVSMVNNGQEAIDTYTHHAYDLILMDCQMPILDGYATTKRIREIEKQHGRVETPIIAITANSEEDNIKRCKDVGMNDFISKPFKKNILAEKIHRWVYH